ncbi:dipeptidase 1-like isoform X2 [Phlebotomus papatasi]|uniref:dipeptidase 1-like isoform X2 n=1 Tax=Phlebotomus papatasi TaxID=29031 RepID=UPI00248367EE|nr:dipeptidase 1-like isoform X2 [Phlebotomus papatasi]
MVLSATKKKWLIFGGGALVLVVALAIALPLTVGKSVSSVQGSDTFRGSSVLDEVPLIDGHNDLPHNLYSIEKNQLANFNFDSDLRLHPIWGPRSSSHTDLPRLRTGKVGGQFWVAYVSCDTQHKDAVERTMAQIDVIKRLIKKYPNDLQYATTADEIEAAFKAGKIASLIVVEGGHSIDDRLSVLRLYYELGVRYMTLTHSCNQPWVDASPIDDTTNEKRNLTDFGVKVVWEMNRLGMMVDISHVSAGVMHHALDVSRAPVIFSHSSSYAMYPHHRNAKDDVLARLPQNGGIIMVNFYSFFVAGQDATIDDVIRHINHIRDVAGVDHVGLGGDYDGVSRQPIGLEDVSKYPDLFDKLAQPGHGYEPWTPEELKKLAGLNILRVMRQVEQVAAGLVSEEPYELNIPDEDIHAFDPNQSCKTDFRYNPSNEMFTEI